jgi:HK97 gp10 family phage protein
MVGKVEFTIRGAKEMEAALKELGPQVANRLGDRALRAAARPIVREAKRLVPKDSRALMRSITVVKGRAQNNVREIKIGFKKPRSRIAHLVEFGFVHKGGDSVAARPFVRPAMDSQAAAALTAMAEDLAKGIAQQEYKRAVAAGVDFSEFDNG